MAEYKLLFTGPMGAGKTTAIAAVSEVAPVITDVRNTDQSVLKERTTVGLDFGVLSLDNGDRLRLFGTPGQVRFDFLWKILAKNVLGIVILIDNSKPEPLADLALYLDGFCQELRDAPCVIGVGRTETHLSPSLNDFTNAVNERGLVLPVMAVDVRSRDDVVLLIDCLLAQIEASLYMENNQ